MASETLVSVLAAIFTGICIICYCNVVWSQKKKLKEGTKRLQVLSTRAAFCVPVYAVIILISLLAPSAYVALEIPISIFEGYSFYCFFCLLVTNLGGPNETVKLLQSNNKPLFLGCCCPSDKANFYNQVQWALFHFILTRVVIVIITVIVEDYKIPFVILSIVAFALLVNAVLSTIIFFENVYEQCANLMAISKFLVIKVSVGLIVIQGLIVQIIIALNKVSLKSDSQFTGDERAVRLYCFIVLVEFLAISAIMLVSFSYEILPSSHSPLKDDPSTYTPLDWSLGKFLYEVFQVHDVFGYLRVSESGSPSKV